MIKRYREKQLYTLLIGMKISPATVEKYHRDPLKTKIRMTPVYYS